LLQYKVNYNYSTGIGTTFKPPTTLVKKLRKLSKQMETSFYIGNTLEDQSSVPDYVTIVNIRDFRTSTQRLAELLPGYHTHSPSILMSRDKIFVFRANVAYRDLRTAVELFLDKPALTMAVELHTLAYKVMNNRKAWLDDVNYEIENLECRVSALYDRKDILRIGIHNWTQDSFRREIEKLMRRPYAGNVSLTQGSYVKLRMKDKSIIKLTEQQEVHLGPFDIKVDLLSPSISHVTFANLNNPWHSYDHPHICEGEPCWGAFRGQAIEFLNKMKMVKFFDLATVFLQSYTPDDRYCTAARFLKQAEDYPEGDEEDMNDSDLEVAAIQNRWTDGPAPERTEAQLSQDADSDLIPDMPEPRYVGLLSLIQHPTRGETVHDGRNYYRFVGERGLVWINVNEEYSMPPPRPTAEERRRHRND